jgi:HAD superfamily hydrolase (TIGR01458 family)
VIDADGVLLDIEGTLVVSWEPVPGAQDALRALRNDGFPLRLVTNTTSTTRSDLVRRLREAGIEVDPEDVVTAPVVTAAYLRMHHPGARCLLLGEGGAAEDLDGVELVQGDVRADVVVVAGADPAYTWENLNRAFRMALGGAAIVAMHRNLAWRTEHGMMLDSGAFLMGLEAAAGVEATIIGKPSRDFFQQAVDLLGIPAERVAMVGDDLDNDVLAAQSLGLTGVLVKTGKFRQEALDASDGAPDHVIESIADLPDLIAR